MATVDSPNRSDAPRLTPAGSHHATRMAVLATIVTGAACAMLPGAAVAQVTPIAPGSIELRWDQCYTDGGSDFKTFACDTNTGVEVLVFTVTPGMDLPELNGMEGDVILLADAPSLPSWWDFGGCRNSASLAADFINVPPGSAGCLDVWQGAAAGGLNYTEGYTAPNQARVSVVAAILGTRSTTSGQNLFLFTLSIQHSRTTGTGSCTGCDVPFGIGFERVLLTQPAGSDSPYVLYPIDGTDSDFVSWQSRFATSRTYFHSMSTGWHKTFTLDSPTETLRPTWGAVKSLYR